MLIYHYQEEKRDSEADYYRTAWFTSLLMNATGNYKTPVTPEKLLGKDFGKESESKGNKSVDRNEKNRKLAELKKRFNTNEPLAE